jgi:maleylpyruvate isomerase
MMKLYSFWRSSCSWRVRLALAIKGLEYEIVPVRLLNAEHHAAGFDQKSPLRQVPVLELLHAGELVRLTQSVAILEYLEAVHPTPALYPQDILLRTRVRQLVEMVNAGIQPAQNLQVMQEVERLGADKKAWACNFIERGLAALESAARPLAGTFLVGDSASAADVFLAPQLYNARRFRMDLSAFSTLLRAEASLKQHPAWAPAHPDAQPDAETE